MQGLNGQICQWFAISMLHLLWQAFIPFAIWLACNRWFVDRPHARYLSGLVALAAIATCLPINLCYFRDIASNPSAHTGKIEIANTDAALSPAPEADQLSPIPLNAVEIANGQEQKSFSIPNATGKLYPSLVGFYFVGLLFFSLRMLSGSWITFRLRRHYKEITEPEVLSTISRTLHAAGLACAPAVRWCEAVSVPALVGVFKPIILLPLHCATELSISQIEQILLHELAHFRRCDPFLNMLQNMLETVFFFHPLVWFISGRVRLDREIACDQIVISAGYATQEYALALIQIASLGKKLDLSPLVGIASTGRSSQLQIRIRSLYNERQRVAYGGLHLLCGATLLLGSLTLTTQLISTAKAQAGQDTIQTNEDVLPSNAAVVHEIVGRVIDSEGNSIAGAKVDLLPGFEGDEAITNEHGSFGIKSKHKGDSIEMLVSKDGYSPYYNLTSLAPGSSLEVTVLLGQKTYIEGTVRDPNGNPASNVEIYAKPQYEKRDKTGLLYPGPSYVTRCDAKGVYRIYVSSDTYRLEMRLPGIGVSRIENIEVANEQSKTVDVQLNQSVRFEAHVIDRHSGKLVSGVHLFSEEPWVVGTSDKDGKIVIEDMLPGTQSFKVGEGEPITKKGITYYTPKTLGRWWSEDGNQASRRDAAHESRSDHFQRNIDGLTFNLAVGMEPVTIIVEQAVTFRGTVYDPNGKTVAGATVGFAYPDSVSTISGDGRYSVRTKADGTYEAVVPAGKEFRYNLVAHDGAIGESRVWANGFSGLVKSVPGETKSGFDLHLNHSGTVRGRIIKSNDRSSWKGREVWAMAVDKKDILDFVSRADVTEDGTFELKGLREGEHSIQFRPFLSDSNSASSFAIVDIQAGQTLEGIELRLTATTKTNLEKLGLTLDDSKGTSLIPRLGNDTTEVFSFNVGLTR